MSFYDTFRDLLVEDRETRDATGRRGGGAGGTIDGETAARFAAEFGGYMQPGTGVVDAGGRYPALTDPEQAYYPGLIENLREGNFGMAAGQAGGFVGDLLYGAGAAAASTGAGAPIGGLLAGAGAIAKVPRAAMKAGKAVKGAKAAGKAADASRGAQVASSAGPRQPTHAILAQRQGEVLTAAEGRYDAGIHTATLSLTSLRPGAYMYQLRSGNGVLSKRMLVIR